LLIVDTIQIIQLETAEKAITSYIDKVVLDELLLSEPMIIGNKESFINKL